MLPRRGPPARRGRIVVLVCALALAAPACAGATLLRGDTTPFPPSKRIVAAWWTTPRFGPPPNQTGDVLPTIWGDDGNQYTLIDDGGAEVPIAGGMWRQSLARIIGSPPRPRFRHVGNPYNPPARTYAQIMSNPKLWLGPLGPYYSSGLVEANHIFFATQQYDWDWTENGLFAGLDGIAYSLDHGRNWLAVNKPFPAPLGNLSWVIRGRGGVYPDGWVYAIGSEREFNASTLILGRSRPDIADMTDPSRWEWLSRSPSSDHPTFSNSFSNAVPILSWNSRISYPQIAYDSPIHRYLLTFTWSYGTKPPATWRRGMELVILEARHPWGPFSFVARERYFGPSNGYGAGFPIKWISRNGHNVWMKWAANFDGCAPRLDCSGAYGFNFRRLHLKLAGDR